MKPTREVQVTQFACSACERLHRTVGEAEQCCQCEDCDKGIATERRAGNRLCKRCVARRERAQLKREIKRYEEVIADEERRVEIRKQELETKRLLLATLQPGKVTT